MAPMVRVIGIPSRILPTSVSSNLPLKIMSCMLAMVAMVVPSLKVLELITELPTLTGMSRIMPEMVALMVVLLYPAVLFEMPSLMILSWSLALL